MPTARRTSSLGLSAHHFSKAGVADRGVVLRDLGRALHTASRDLLPELPHADKASVLSPRGTADLDDPDRQLKVEVIDAPTQELSPDAAARTRRAARCQGIYADGSAHAGKLGPEGRVGADVFRMGLSKVLKQRPEDRQLCLERLRIGAPQRTAVRGKLRRRQPRAIKSREADSLARHGDHRQDRRSCEPPKVEARFGQ